MQSAKASRKASYSAHDTLSEVSFCSPLACNPETTNCSRTICGQQPSAAAARELPHHEAQHHAEQRRGAAAVRTRHVQERRGRMQGRCESSPGQRHPPHRHRGDIQGMILPSTPSPCRSIRPRQRASCNAPWASSQPRTPEWCSVSRKWPVRGQWRYLEFYPHELRGQLSGCRKPCLQNEEAIAEALQEAGCPRDSVFITSKLSPYQQGRDKAEAACQDILTRLKTDYVVRCAALLLRCCTRSAATDLPQPPSIDAA